MTIGGSLTLSDVAGKTDTLVIACTRCERAGRYRVDTLIERHSPDLTIPLLLRELSANCPKRQSITVYDLCGIHCPDLPALFITAVPRPQ